MSAIEIIRVEVLMLRDLDRVILYTALPDATPKCHHVHLTLDLAAGTGAEWVVMNLEMYPEITMR
jgi:hypothetical protein